MLEIPYMLTYHQLAKKQCLWRSSVEQDFLGYQKPPILLLADKSRCSSPEWETPPLKKKNALLFLITARKLAKVFAAAEANFLEQLVLLAKALRLCRHRAPTPAIWHNPRVVQVPHATCIEFLAQILQITRDLLQAFEGNPSQSAIPAAPSTNGEAE